MSMHVRRLEVVADGQLCCHSHAAMQLHGLLADEVPRTANHCLGRGQRFAALVSLWMLDQGGRLQGHRACLLDRDLHVRHAMLPAPETGR